MKRFFVLHWASFNRGLRCTPCPTARVCLASPRIVPPKKWPVIPNSNPEFPQRTLECCSTFCGVFTLDGGFFFSFGCRTNPLAFHATAGKHHQVPQQKGGYHRVFGRPTQGRPHPGPVFARSGVIRGISRARGRRRRRDVGARKARSRDAPPSYTARRGLSGNADNIGVPGVIFHHRKVGRGGRGGSHERES